jgi:hypothetical protein
MTRGVGKPVMFTDRGVNLRCRNLVTAKGSSEKTLNGRELHKGALLEGHDVKLRTLGIPHLLEEVSPVLIRFLEGFLNRGAFRDGSNKDISSRLLANDSDVPLRSC